MTKEKKVEEKSYKKIIDKIITMMINRCIYSVDTHASNVE